MCLTYKWTIADCDELELPMIHVLLGEISESPSADFLMNAQIKAQLEHVRQKKQAEVDSFPKTPGKVRKRKHDD